MRRFLRAAMVLALIALPAAPQRPAQPHRRAPRPTAVSPLGDEELEKQIRERLAGSAIGGEKFTVRVQGGVATIEGRTDQIQHKSAATRLAKAAGAVGVNNRVELSERVRQQAAANLAQGRRREQIKRGEARSGAPPPRAGSGAPGRRGSHRKGAENAGKTRKRQEDKF